MYLSEQGFDPVYGARPLKRVIQRQVQDVIATGLLKGDFKEGDNILIALGKKGLEFKKG
jgi:ATP-dependent Clp protease ATP-binding subunit ClpA